MYIYFTFTGKPRKSVTEKTLKKGLVKYFVQKVTFFRIIVAKAGLILTLLMKSLQNSDPNLHSDPNFHLSHYILTLHKIGPK